MSRRADGRPRATVAPRVHLAEPMHGWGTACGLAAPPARVTPDLERATCKPCIRVVTTGHR